MSDAALAEALWSTLEEKIVQVKATPSAPVPPLVQVMSDAYHRAQQVRYHTFVLTEEPDKPAQPADGTGNP